MIRRIKSIASKSTLTVLVSIHLTLTVLGSIFYFLNLFELYSDIFTSTASAELMHHLAPSIAIHFTNYISPVLLFIAILNFKSSLSEKLFSASVITGAALSLFFSIIYPLMISSEGFGIVNTRNIGNIVLLLPGIFIFLDFITNHKWAKISCILSVVMTVLQLINFFSNFAMLMIYGSMYSSSLIGSVRTILYWIIMLLYLIGYVKTDVHTIHTHPEQNMSSHEKRLLVLKNRYELGEITEEEYSSIKDIILQDFITHS